MLLSLLPRWRRRAGAAVAALSATLLIAGAASARDVFPTTTAKPAGALAGEAPRLTDSPAPAHPTVVIRPTVVSPTVVTRPTLVSRRTVVTPPTTVGQAGVRWQAPLARMEVERPYQAPPHPYAAGHRGVDLRARPGAAVVAAGAGVISFAGPVAGRGVVVVDHGGLRTTYEPVRPEVRAGQRVVAGQGVGHLDVVGSHCLPLACLHWGARIGDRYVDPLLLLGPGPVRLLPW